MSCQVQGQVLWGHSPQASILCLTLACLLELNCEYCLNPEKADREKGISLFVGNLTICEENNSFKWATQELASCFLID